MDLILWRHAEAGDHLDDPQADLERPLSPKGERQAYRFKLHDRPPAVTVENANDSAVCVNAAT